MAKVFYRINCGHKAVDNGAVAPLTTMFELARAVGTQLINGEYYGQDYLVAPRKKEDQEACEQLLNETKLVWEKVNKLPPMLSGYEIPQEPDQSHLTTFPYKE